MHRVATLATRKPLRLAQICGSRDSHSISRRLRLPGGWQARLNPTITGSLLIVYEVNLGHKSFYICIRRVPVGVARDVEN